MIEFFSRWLTNPTVGKILTTIVGLVIINAVVRIARRTVSNYVRDTDSRYRARKFITFIGYFVSVLLISIIFSDRLGGLTVAFGVAGAGIAFSLQEVIASVAGWLAVSLGGFYNVGDRVQLGGIKGDVIDISILRTTVMECGEWVHGDLYTGRIVRIANSYVFKEPVFNYSGDFPFLWDEITVPVKYGSDHKQAREILHRVAMEVVGEYAPEASKRWNELIRQYKLEEAKIEPAVTLVANDNWIEFTIRYVVDYKTRRGTKDKLFTGILDAFDATEGRVAFASATFQLVEVPVFDVRISEPRNGNNQANIGITP